MISVIVPVYKSERTLRRCVESLKAQTETELEIILVDDGSPDGCPALCDALAQQDTRIRVIHKENGGVSSARNAGLRVARGTYIQFLDSDDYVEPECCQVLKQELEKQNGRIAICGYHHHYVGADVEKIPRAGESLLELYERGFLNMPWNKLFLREWTGSFPEDISLGEDLLFNLDYLQKCRRLTAEKSSERSWLALVEQPLCHYIQEESGQTLSGQKRSDKKKLAKRIRQEALKFFLEAEPGQEQAVRQVVETRFLCEFLDQVEGLPFDKELSRKQKREEIRCLCQDEEIQQACRQAVPKPLDYRLLRWSLGHGLVEVTYALSVLRSLVVRLKRRFL